MRSVGTRVAAASATFLALLGLTVGSAQGDRIVETVYAAPTTYVSPTSYVVPSSYVTTSSSVVSTGATYVVPSSTSYVLPASYATTAYSYLPSYSVTPTTYYVPTVYRRPGLFRRLASRPVYETTQTYAYDLTPTTYYQPTTISYASPVTTTSLGYASYCNESAVPFNPPSPPVASSGNGNGAASQAGSVQGDTNPTAKSFTSSPRNNPEPPYHEVVPEKAKAAATGVPKDTTKDATLSPPEGPAPEKELNPPVPGGLVDPPAAEEPKSMAAPTDRTNFRPRFTEMKPREVTTPTNVLRGEVVSGLTGKPIPNMEVIFSDPKDRYPDRKRTTDDKGAFEIFLPNGGWTVRVVEPGSLGGTKPKEYGQITSTSGRYLDDSDSTIYGLRLSH